MFACSQTAAMVAASSSTNTATGRAPRCRAACAMSAAVATLTDRCAFGHRIMPVPAAQPEAERAHTGGLKIITSQAHGRGSIRGGQISRVTPMKSAPERAASAASCGLWTPHIFTSGEREPPSARATFCCLQETSTDRTQLLQACSCRAGWLRMPVAAAHLRDEFRAGRLHVQAGIKGTRCRPAARPAPRLLR